MRVYFPKTRSKHNVDIVTFSPTVIPFPNIDLDNYLRQTAVYIITIIPATPSPSTSTLKVGDPTQNILLEIATVLTRADMLPTPVLTPSPQRVPETQ